MKVSLHPLLSLQSLYLPHLQVDPYRLDNLDTYSNLLYVKEQRVELAHLAHR